MRNLFVALLAVASMAAAASSASALEASYLGVSGPSANYTAIKTATPAAIAVDLEVKNTTAPAFDKSPFYVVQSDVRYNSAVRDAGGN